MNLDGLLTSLMAYKCLLLYWDFYIYYRSIFDASCEGVGGDEQKDVMAFNCKHLSQICPSGEH